jgi:hypothetical protein
MFVICCNHSLDAKVGFEPTSRDCSAGFKGQNISRYVISQYYQKAEFYRTLGIVPHAIISISL